MYLHHAQYHLWTIKFIICLFIVTYEYDIDIIIVQALNV